MEFKNIIFNKTNHICTITLNRPEVYNAIDSRTWQEIRTAFENAGSDRAVRTVILTGSGGKAFASGADVRMLNKRTVLETIHHEVQPALSLIENLEKPVIAAIDGFALGGGCELAMACDIRIATLKSKFGQPEVGLGIIPGGGGTQRLQRLVGIGKAKELIFTGDIITAEEALQIGLVNKIVSISSDLLPAAQKMAEKINSKGPIALLLAKTAINTGSNLDMNSGLMVEKLAQAVAFSTQDRLEGTRAFLEKRQPEYKGE